MTERRFQYDPAIVNEAIDIRRLAENLGANFQSGGAGNYVTRCVMPDHPDRTPSMFIWPDTNHFYCFGCKRGGDPLAMIREYYGWTQRSDFKKVIEEGARFAGVRSDIDQSAIDEARKIQYKKRKAHEEMLEADRRAKSEKARARWFSAEPLTDQSIAYHYLKNRRGVDLHDLSHWPKAMRFLPAAPWNMAPKGEAEDWQHFPAIVTAMTSGQRGVSGVHTTYLRADGSDVAREVAQKGRIVSGSVSGAAMRLSHGHTGLKPKEAFERHGMVDKLALCEGLEDALSLALLFPEYRVWAAYSRDNIGRIEPPDCAAEVIIAAENDEGPAHEQAWQKVREQQLKRGRGRLLSIAFPPPDLKDWNAVHEVTND